PWRIEGQCVRRTAKRRPPLHEVAIRPGIHKCRGRRKAVLPELPIFFRIASKKEGRFRVQISITEIGTRSQGPKFARRSKRTRSIMQKKALPELEILAQITEMLAEVSDLRGAKSVRDQAESARRDAQRGG